MADDRFKMSRNVLATDKVPNTIFGIPIVSRRGDYTEDDIVFFREYPEAGGYYDMGDGDDTVRGAIGGGDSVPDAVREFYRDPLTGNENVPDSVKRDWEVYRTMHPDAAGYSWNSVKGFSIAKDIDPGFAQVPEAKDIDPGFTRPPKEKPTWYEHKDYVPGTGKNKYGESVVGYPESEYEYTRRDNPTRIDPKDIKGTGVSFTDADRVRVPKERMEEYGKWLDGRAALDPTMKTQTLVPPDWRTNPKWKEFQRDYDYGAAFMAGAKVPTAKAPDGRYHLSDAGKLPTHPTFSRESYYARDPRWSGLAGEWTKEGNYIPGELESRRGTRQAASGGVSDVEAYVKRINAAVTDVIPFIKEHEGFRAQAYKDSVGKWTVGYGQTEINGRPVEEGDTISEEDASAFVAQRARENAVALYKQNPWMRNLAQGALSALYDVAYNLGASALSGRRSPTLNYDMESADMDWDSIVWRELPTYVKAGGKTLNGLVNRRNDAIRKWRTQ